MLILFRGELMDWSACSILDRRVTMPSPWLTSAAVVEGFESSGMFLEERCATEMPTSASSCRILLFRISIVSLSFLRSVSCCTIVLRQESTDVWRNSISGLFTSIFEVLCLWVFDGNLTVGWS